MSIYEIFTIIISFFSIIISLVAVVIAYLPYAKKIIFKVDLFPFKYTNGGFEIRFLIINKTNKDLIVTALCASKILSIQAFDKKDYPSIVKSNNHVIFSIDSSKLKFDTMSNILEKETIDKSEKKVKYINFYIKNSVRDSITYKMRIKDYENACKLFELSNKNKNKPTTLEEDLELSKEFLYYCRKNKSRFSF